MLWFSCCRFGCLAGGFGGGWLLGLWSCCLTGMLGLVIVFWVTSGVGSGGLIWLLVVSWVLMTIASGFDVGDGRCFGVV